MIQEVRNERNILQLFFSVLGYLLQCIKKAVLKGSGTRRVIISECPRYKSPAGRPP
jgi:hypothetical protein